jgi:hypothetical protein
MTWAVMFVGPVSAGQLRPSPAFDSIDECREVVHRRVDASLDCVEVKIGWGP